MTDNRYAVPMTMNQYMEDEQFDYRGLDRNYGQRNQESLRISGDPFIEQNVSRNQHNFNNSHDSFYDPISISQSRGQGSDVTDAFDQRHVQQVPWDHRQPPPDNVVNHAYMDLMGGVAGNSSYMSHPSYGNETILDHFHHLRYNENEGNTVGMTNPVRKVFGNLYLREENIRRKQPGYRALTGDVYDLNIVMPLCINNGKVVVSSPSGDNFYEFDDRYPLARILFGREYAEQLKEKDENSLLKNPLEKSDNKMTKDVTTNESTESTSSQPPQNDYEKILSTASEIVDGFHSDVFESEKREAAGVSDNALTVTTEDRDKDHDVIERDSEFVLAEDKKNEHSEVTTPTDVNPASNIDETQEGEVKNSVIDDAEEATKDSCSHNETEPKKSQSSVAEHNHSDIDDTFAEKVETFQKDDISIKAFESPVSLAESETVATPNNETNSETCDATTPQVQVSGNASEDLVCDTWASFLHIKLGTIYNVREEMIPHICELFRKVFANGCDLTSPVYFGFSELEGIVDRNNDSIQQDAGPDTLYSRIDAVGTLFSDASKSRFRTMKKYLKMFAREVMLFSSGPFSNVNLSSCAPFDNTPEPRVTVELSPNCKARDDLGVRVSIREWSPLSKAELESRICNALKSNFSRNVDSTNTAAANKYFALKLFERNSRFNFFPNSVVLCQSTELRLEHTRLRMVDPRWPSHLVLSRRIVDLAPDLEIPISVMSEDEHERARCSLCTNVDVPEIQYRFVEPTYPKGRLLAIYLTHVNQHPESEKILSEWKQLHQKHEEQKVVVTEEPPKQNEIVKTHRHQNALKTVACRYFKRGICYRGDSCFFLHDDSTNGMHSGLKTKPVAHNRKMVDFDPSNKR